LWELARDFSCDSANRCTNRERLLSVLALPQGVRSINHDTDAVIGSDRYFRAAI
jgi:hypothetical protein